MTRPPAPPSTRAVLRFDESLDPSDARLRGGISSMTRAGDYLWVAFVASATIERLRWDGEAYGEHRRFPLAHFVDLPADADVEMDIEGLDVADGYLWVSGSMSKARGTPDPADSVGDQVEALETVAADDNRYNFIRLPLVTAADGHPEPRKVVVREGKTIVAAHLKAKGKSNKLIRALRKDDHLGEYMEIPREDNGFEIEGLTVVGERVFLGLRGPVLNSYAVILEVQFGLKKKGKRLKLRKIGKHKERFRKHFFNFDGMGVRGCYHNADNGHLLVLTGPTMALGGDVTVWRVSGGIPDQHTNISHEPERLRDLPRAGRDAKQGTEAESLCDHVEGGYLVAYDTPADRGKAGEVWAEVFGEGHGDEA